MQPDGIRIFAWTVGLLIAVGVLILVVRALACRTAPRPVPGASPSLRRIQRVSHGLRVAVVTLTVLSILCIAGLLCWNTLSKQVHAAHFNATLHVEAVDSSAGASTAAIILATLPDLFVAWCLIRLLSLYAAGVIFERRNAFWIRSIGYSLVLVGSGAFSSLVSLLFLWSRPTPEFQFSIEIDVLIAGACIIILSWVMDEASRLRADQELTV